MSLNCTVSKNDLLEGLNSLQNITNKKGTLAILSNVLIDTVTVASVSPVPILKLVYACLSGRNS